MATALLVNRMLGLRNLEQFKARGDTRGARRGSGARFKDKDGRAGASWT